jgi:hypothetical protein
MSDLKRSTVEKAAEQIKKSNPSMSAEKAHKIAREGAEKINRERRSKEG